MLPKGRCVFRLCENSDAGSCSPRIRTIYTHENRAILITTSEN